jgi:predicted metal-dependent hydrolase
MSEDFDVQLLETKKKKFIEVVNRICENRNLPVPYINFDGCPEENEDQLAHYHSDVNMICISKRQLTVLNFDDLEEVAAHEVAHILEPNHDTNFIREENINKQVGWIPPPGVVVINGDQPVDDSIKETMKKTEETLKRLEEEEKWKQMEEERNNYLLMPKPEIEQDEHVLTPEEIIKLTGSHEPVKEEKEDFDSHVKQEAVNEEKNEKKESKEEGTKRMKEELEGKLEGTIYSDLQNVNTTNIPKEEVMPEDLSTDRIIEESRRTIKEANELRKLYSPKLRFRLLREIKNIFRR